MNDTTYEDKHREFYNWCKDSGMYDVFNEGTADEYVQIKSLNEAQMDEFVKCVLEPFLICDLKKETYYRPFYYASAFNIIGNPQNEENLMVRRWLALGRRHAYWPSKDMLETVEARKEASRPVHVDVPLKGYKSPVPVSAKKRDGNDSWSIPGCRCCWCGDRIKSNWEDFYEVRWSDETITYLEDCCAYEFIHGGDNRSGYGVVPGIEE